MQKDICAPELGHVVLPEHVVVPVPPELDPLLLLHPPELVLPAMEAVRLTIEQEAMVRQGRAVRVLPEPGGGPLRAHNSEGRLVALGHRDPLRKTFVPEKVLT